MKLKFWGVKTLTIHVVTGTFPSEVGAKNNSDLVSWLIIPLNKTGLNGNFFFPTFDVWFICSSVSIDFLFCEFCLLNFLNISWNLQNSLIRIRVVLIRFQCYLCWRSTIVARSTLLNFFILTSSVAKMENSKRRIRSYLSASRNKDFYIN